MYNDLRRKAWPFPESKLCKRIRRKTARSYVRGNELPDTHFNTTELYLIQYGPVLAGTTVFITFSS